MSKEGLKWYEKSGAESDVVISSRVRLARNLKKYPFSARLSEEQAVDIIQETGACVEELKEKLQEQVGDICYFDRFQALTENDRLALVERHAVSPAFVMKKHPGGLILTADEAVGIMINEEDHLRIQAISAGMDIERSWELAGKIDDILDERLTFAYDKQYGYLTSCPTNVGTGLRASYMMFLPALTNAGKIQQLADEMAAYGITMRGIYGEGTSALGDIYQISNQRTLGNSEQEMMDNLNNIVYQIIRQERKRRELLRENHYDEIEDQVNRSYGVLKYATKLSSSDAMTLLGQLKLGVDEGLLRLKEELCFYKMIIAVQRGNIQMRIGRSCGNLQRDKYRAEYVRRNLPEMKE